MEASLSLLIKTALSKDGGKKDAGNMAQVRAGCVLALTVRKPVWHLGFKFGCGESLPVNLVGGGCVCWVRSDDGMCLFGALSVSLTSIGDAFVFCCARGALAGAAAAPQRPEQDPQAHRDHHQAPLRPLSEPESERDQHAPQRPRRWTSTGDEAGLSEPASDSESDTPASESSCPSQSRCCCSLASMVFGLSLGLGLGVCVCIPRAGVLRLQRCKFGFKLAGGWSGPRQRGRHTVEIKPRPGRPSLRADMHASVTVRNT